MLGNVPASDSTSREAEPRFGKHRGGITEQVWFHGPLNPKIAYSRLLNNGSFLMTVDEHDSSLFHLYVKWNGQYFDIDIPYDYATQKYVLGSVERDNVVELIDFYKRNQLPVREDIGAMLFVPIAFPRISSLQPTDGMEGTGNVIVESSSLYDKTASGLPMSREGLRLSQYDSTPPTGRRLVRKRNRYLHMEDRPRGYMNANVNRSLGNLTSIYCDPSSLSGSTLSLPPAPLTNMTTEDANFERLARMCQGFVDYDLSRASLMVVDVSKPLDTEALLSVAKVLLSAGAEVVATCLASEVVSIIILEWLAEAGCKTSRPSDGYSLLLWPAANGYRRDLFNRWRFLSLFITASIVICKENDTRAAMLTLWVDVIGKLVETHRDYFTANALANGVCVDQILKEKCLWEKVFPCGGSLEVVDRLKCLLSGQVGEGAGPTEMGVSCLTQIGVCVPNIGPVLGELYCVQPRDVDSGGLPPASLLQKLSILKVAYRRGRGGNAYDDLWVKKRWSRLQTTKIPNELQSIFKTENILLILLGPVDVSRDEDLDDCCRRLPEMLSSFSD